MITDDLEKEFGRVIRPIELAKFLDIDVRTVKKYYYMWGGVHVTPNDFRFFENLVKEAINANNHNETWEKAMESRRDPAQTKIGKAVPRCVETKPDGRYPVGAGRGRTAQIRRRGQPIPDTHGLFDS
jgi:hypothetical protein